MKTRNTNEYNNDRYDEMKSLLNLSRNLFEQVVDDTEKLEIENKGV